MTNPSVYDLVGFTHYFIEIDVYFGFRADGTHAGYQFTGARAAIQIDAHTPVMKQARQTAVYRAARLKRR